MYVAPQSLTAADVGAARASTASLMTASGHYALHVCSQCNSLSYTTITSARRLCKLCRALSKQLQVKPNIFPYLHACMLCHTQVIQSIAGGPAGIGTQDDEKCQTGSTSATGPSSARCMQQPPLQVPEVNAHLAGTTSTDQAQHQAHNAFHGSRQHSPHARNAEDSAHPHQADVHAPQCAQTADVQMQGDAAMDAVRAMQGSITDAHADTAHGAGDPVCLPTTPQLPASLLRYNHEWAMEVYPGTVQLCEYKHNQSGIGQDTGALLSLAYSMRERQSKAADMQHPHKLN